MKNCLLLLLLTLIIVSCSTSYPTIKVVEGEYHHNSSGLTFPERFHDFQRYRILSSDKNDIGVEVIYKSNDNSKFSINIYPAPAAYEPRFRDEFFESLQDISNKYRIGIDFENSANVIEKDGYRLNGFNGTGNTRFKTNVRMSLFECGTKFYKYIIESKTLNMNQIDSISNYIIQMFSPIEVVKRNALKIRANIHIAPGMVQDSSVLHATLAGVMAKAKWIHEEIDSLEKISGFPSLYFNVQKLTVEQMVQTWDTLQHNNSIHDEYFNDLSLIMKNDFLDEFIFDEYNGFLLLPSDLELDLTLYRRWRNKNKISAKLTGIIIYLLGYTTAYD